MGRSYEFIKDGHLAVARPRRGYCEVKVYRGETEDTELVADWEMPRGLNSALHLAAQQGHIQTTFDTTEGDTK